VKCPFSDENGFKCDETLDEQTIKILLDTASWENFQLKKRTLEELLTKNRFHCLNVNCDGWFEIENERTSLHKCPSCLKFNCILCKKILNEEVNNHNCSKNDENDQQIEVGNYYLLKLE
jgi:hypothetical protein